MLKSLIKSKAIPVVFLALFISSTAFSADCVAIIGGGIAGLSAQHELAKNGICSHIYEAADRWGGRVRTGPSVDGIYTNAGAEFVDSTHSHVLSYMREFNIPLNPRTSPPHYQSDHFIYQGRVFTHDEVNERIFKDNPLAISRLLADEGNAAKHASLVHMNLDQYLNSLGFDGFAKSFFTTELKLEVGLDTKGMSAATFAELFRFDPNARSLRFLPENDEAYRVMGGTQRIVDALHFQHPTGVDLQTKLTSISSSDGKTFHLAFATPQGERNLAAHDVIITVPFHQLKDVHLNVGPIPSDVSAAISHTTYGKHTKLVIYFNRRMWNEAGHTGDIVSDKGYQIFDSSHGQPGKSGSLTAYIGDTLEPAQQEAKVKQVLGDLEKLFPGISKTYTTSQAFSYEHSYTGMAGVSENALIPKRPTQLGKHIFFAGEGISMTDPGYMNGAIGTAKDAVDKISTARNAETVIRRSRCIMQAIAPALH
ncbi:MAG: FAD-dependent oxidoreductase [Oligoflexia bacterium]|nr:FAD-dependent oxidoreductase [Oligoflexia bacterium]